MKTPTSDVRTGAFGSLTGREDVLAALDLEPVNDLWEAARRGSSVPVEGIPR